MRVKIKRLDKTLPLPKFETTGAVGFDFIAAKDTKVPPKEIVLISSNNIIEVPSGYMLVVAPRSSTPKKTGLAFPHSIGIIDQDYFGSDDEIKIQVYNFTDKEVMIKKGDKIAQGVFVKIEIATWEEIDQLGKKSRGGFGSTG